MMGPAAASNANCLSGTLVDRRAADNSFFQLCLSTLTRTGYSIGARLGESRFQLAFGKLLCKISLSFSFKPSKDKALGAPPSIGWVGRALL